MGTAETGERLSVGILRELPLPDYARLDLAYQVKGIFPSPAAGVNFTSTIPGEFFLIPFYFQVFFTSSAVAATRVVNLRIADSDGTDIMTIPPAYTQAASLTSNYRFVGAASASYNPAAATESVVPLPPILVEPGMKFMTAISGLQAGDLLTFIRLVAIRIPTGPSIEQSGPAIVHPVAIPVTGLAA